MVEIRNRKDLEAWLKIRPHEDAVVIAARAALRVLPLLVSLVRRDATKHRANIILPTLFAASAPWVAAVGPTQGADVHEAAAAAAAAAAYAARAYAAAPAAYAARAAAAFAARAAAYSGRAAAVDAAAHAARAAAASASRATATAVWETLSADVRSLEDGRLPEQVASMRLWRDQPPDSAVSAWSELKAHLLAADDGWAVWTSWYEDRLHGRRFDKALEEARVLIDLALWDQGPKVVNAEIARLIEEYASKSDTPDALEPGNGEAAPEPDQPEHSDADPNITNLKRALDLPQLRASLSEFKHDPAANRIDLAPFPKDLPDLPAGAMRADHANKLAALAEGCTSLATDLKEDSPNVPKALARDLRRYAKQAGNGPEQANPRLLRMYGAALTRANGDSETMLGLDGYLGGKLTDVVNEHTELMADYPVAISDPMEAAADILLAPDATPAAIADELDLIATRMPTAEWGNLPVPSVDLPDLLHAQADHLRAMTRQIDLTGDAEVRAKLERLRKQTEVSALSTVARFTVFTASVAVAASAPLPSIGLTASGFGIVMFVDWLYPDTLKPHLRRVIDWLFMRDPDRT